MKRAKKCVPEPLGSVRHLARDGTRIVGPMRLRETLVVLVVSDENAEALGFTGRGFHTLFVSPFVSGYQDREPRGRERGRRGRELVVSKLGARCTELRIVRCCRGEGL